MKSHIKIWVLLLCFSSITMHAQEVVRTTVSENTYKVGLFKKQLLTYPFSAGDTIIITITEKNEKSLAKITIEDANSSFKRVAKAVTSMEERIVISADTDFNILLKQRPTFKKPFGFRRSVYVKIEKEQYIVPEIIEINDFVEMEDVILYDTTVSITQSDTIFTAVLSEKASLGSLIQPGTKTKKTYKIIPIPGATFYVYWIGVGDKIVEDYELLKSNMPTSWTALGIIEPIDAYAIGKLNNMPSRPEGEDVIFSIATTKGKENFLKNQPYRPLFERQGIVSYGMIDARYVPELEPSFICLKNNNEVSPIDISLKMVAVTINNTFEEIITDSVITIRKVFRLNTDAMSFEEAKSALNKTEKELTAAWFRSNQEFDEAQKFLDSSRIARSLELQQAALLLEAERQEIAQKETVVNEKVEAKIQEKIAALESSDGDSAIVAALKMELEVILVEIQLAKRQLQQIEQQRSEITKLMQQDLKKASLKEAEKVFDDAAKKTATEIGKEVQETIIEGTEKVKSILKEGGK
ncbi:MAG: hypothetical protein ACI97N_000516 [Cognaticolwellia sp.]|jgi:hypothetical protein